MWRLLTLPNILLSHLRLVPYIWTGSVLVQIIGGAKQLSELINANKLSVLRPKEHIVIKIVFEIQIFPFAKMYINMSSDI